MRLRLQKLWRDEVGTISMLWCSGGSHAELAHMAHGHCTDKTRQSAYADPVVYAAVAVDPACRPASSTARSLVNHVSGDKS